MKRYQIFIFSFLIFFGCRKDETTPNTTIKYDGISNITLYLDSKERIIKNVTTDNNKKLIEEITYNYYDTLVIQKRTDSLSNYSITRYNLDVNGFCKVRIDSFHAISNIIDTLQTDSVYYFYNSDNFLTTIKFDNTTLSYSYNNGNLAGYANITFSYYDTLNKIDIMNLALCPGIIGKTNKNLTKQEKWLGYAPVDSQIDYNYTLDNNGYVIESIETHYPAYHYPHQIQEKDLKHYLTKYTYIKN